MWNMVPAWAAEMLCHARGGIFQPWFQVQSPSLRTSIIFPVSQQYPSLTSILKKGLFFYSLGSLKLSKAAGAGESSQLVQPGQMSITLDPQGLIIAHLALSFASPGLALSLSWLTICLIISMKMTGNTYCRAQKLCFSHRENLSLHYCSSWRVLMCFAMNWETWCICMAGEDYCLYFPDDKLWHREVK